MSKHCIKFEQTKNPILFAKSHSLHIKTLQTATTTKKKQTKCICNK